MSPENTNTVVDKDRERWVGADGAVGAAAGGRGENRGDESRWKGRKHEAGMTSLGLTFHSRPTPALCILTSLRCVSYILYIYPPLLLFPLSPPPLSSLFRPFFSPVASLLARSIALAFFGGRKGEKKNGEITEGEVGWSRPNNPRLAGPRVLATG